MKTKRASKKNKNHRNTVSRKIPRADRASSIRQNSRGERRKHLDERLSALNQRAMLIEDELRKLEGRFYRTCIFGSARIKHNTDSYRQVEVLAKLLAKEGIDILTGGGPGLMEAANKGAKAGRKEVANKAMSFGLSIQLDFEPEPNHHLDVKRHHFRFSSRLDDFMRLSNSIVVTAGGIGTLLELYFTWQLIQVKHIEKRPIVLMGKVFWSGLMDWMRSHPLNDGLVSKSDFDNIQIVDTPEEVLAIIAVDHKKFLKNRPKLEAISRQL